MPSYIPPWQCWSVNRRHSWQFDCQETVWPIESRMVLRSPWTNRWLYFLLVKDVPKSSVIKSEAMWTLNRELTIDARHQRQPIESLNINFLSAQQLIFNKFIQKNKFLILIFDAKAASTSHPYLSPRQIALLAFGRSAEAVASRASVRIWFRQSECHRLTLIAFHALHESFARTLSTVIAYNRLTAVRRNRTVSITITSFAHRIPEVARRTLVATSADEAFAAHTLARIQITRLPDGTIVIAIAYFASSLVLPAPRIRIALLTIGAFTQRRTNASSRFGITIVGRIRTCITFWKQTRLMSCSSMMKVATKKLLLHPCNENP